jgi:probable addiction module antidote protein
MAIRLKSYRARLMEQLTIPSEAKHYINAALEDSPGMFFEAIKDVAQAHQMAKVAKKSGVARESLYRSLSKRGNPSWNTVLSVLKVLGLENAGVRERRSTTATLTPSSASSRKTIRLSTRRIKTSASVSTVGPPQIAGAGSLFGLLGGFTVPQTSALPIKHANAGLQKRGLEIPNSPAPEPELPPYLSDLLLVRSNGRENAANCTN